MSCTACVIASKAEAPCICYYSDIGLPDNWHYMSCTACIISLYQSNNKYKEPQL
jgi:hypothetical protein